MSENPFIHPGQNPDWSKLTPDHIRTDLTLCLEQAEENLKAIRSLSADETTFENTVRDWREPRINCTSPGLW